MDTNNDEEQKSKRKLFPKLDSMNVFIGILGTVLTIAGGFMFYGFNALIEAKNETIAMQKLYEPEDKDKKVEWLKKDYMMQIQELQKKIAGLDSTVKENKILIENYRKLIFYLQTKISVLKDISKGVRKISELQFESDLIYTELIPFSFYSLPPHNKYFESLLIKQLEYGKFENFNFTNNISSVGKIPVNNYALHGNQSPLFYSFDNVNLRSASFNNTDFRGVDLSTARFDSSTKLPIGVRLHK